MKEAVQSTLANLDDHQKRVLLFGALASLATVQTFRAALWKDRMKITASYLTEAARELQNLRRPRGHQSRYSRDGFV